MRTVLSFNGEQRTLERYRASLQKPMQTGLPVVQSSAFSSQCQPATMGCLHLRLPPHLADRAVCRLKSRPGSTLQQVVAGGDPCCAVQAYGQVPLVAALWALPTQYSCAAMLWLCGTEE